ncbi:MAG: sulfotransferase [Acidimicrobiales bacterium]|nr:sulfotransferase [Acidimicrobiales bacterium]
MSRFGSFRESLRGRSSLGKRGLPPSVRSFERTVTSWARRPTAGGRVFPNFFIVGAQRAGTTSLFRYLERHPNIIGPVRNKGVHYYDTNYHRDLTWFRSQFPTAASVAAIEHATGAPVAVGEGSPYYLFHPQVPARIAGTLPDARIIVLLRDPVDRAISHYEHEKARGFEPLSLADALAAEPERLAGAEAALRADPTLVHDGHLHHAYAGRSTYTPQLERWFNHFDRSQVLVLGSQDLNERTRDAVDRTVDFLGLPAAPELDYPQYNQRQYDPGDAEIRAALAEQFAASNARVSELTGIRFSPAGEIRP